MLRLFLLLDFASSFVLSRFSLRSARILGISTLPTLLVTHNIPYQCT
nr:MAG TPA: hypothetical protein [Caudoviricetes sp.]